jgi:hypothetical protein
MADLTDYIQNVNIASSDNTKIVSLITDGSIERLAVDVKGTVTSGNSNFAKLGKAWSVCVSNFTNANAQETPMFLLRNPNTSGVFIYLLNLVYSTEAQTSILRLYRNPTITTNGTLLSLVNFKVSGAAANGLAYQAPTISNNGILLSIQYTLGQANPSIIPNLIRFLEPNENILITIEAANNKKHYLTLEVGEETIL